MPNHLPKLQIVPRPDTQLQAVNEKISRLAAVKPYGDVYAAFSMAAHLAREAIQAVTELKQMPGVDPKEFQPVIDFWHRLEDLNRVAALDCAGGNQSLAEALVSFRLLRNLEE